MPSRLKPKIISTLQEGYSWAQFSKDSMAGILVGILSLPMSIAFAIGSGARPEQGLYTAIIAGFIIAVLGGSRVQISGPTGAFIILIYTIIQEHGYNGLVIATLMAGVILIAMGYARFGAVIKFIPYPVIIGFTSGLGVVLFSGQIRDLFGLTMTSVPVNFIDKWKAYFAHMSSINLYTAALSAIALIIVIFWPRTLKKIPGTLVAIILTTVLAKMLQLPVETIGSRFGAFPTSLPTPNIPLVSFDTITSLIPSAIAIALLAGIESLLSAVVADGMLGKRHRSDAELVAQGFGNIFSVLFNGIPATGAITRTAINVRSGARTPVAGVINALTILCIMLFVGKWVALVPMATLAALLVVAAYNMSEYRHFIKLFSSPKHDIAVLLTTFLLTVFVDITTAIEAGIILATFLFMSNMVRMTKGRFVRQAKDDDDKDDPLAISLRSVPEEIEVFEIYGPFFFAATEKFKKAFYQNQRIPKVLILRLRHVPTIDATGVRALEDIHRKCKKEGTTLLLSGVGQDLLSVLDKSLFINQLGKQFVFSHIDEALTHAKFLITPAQATQMESIIPTNVESPK